MYEEEKKEGTRQQQKTARVSLGPKNKNEFPSSRLTLLPLARENTTQHKKKNFLFQKTQNLFETKFPSLPACNHHYHHHHRLSLSIFKISPQVLSPTPSHQFQLCLLLKNREIDFVFDLL